MPAGSPLRPVTTMQLGIFILNKKITVVVLRFRKQFIHYKLADTMLYVVAS